MNGWDTSLNGSTPGALSMSPGGGRRAKTASREPLVRCEALEVEFAIRGRGPMGGEPVQAVRDVNLVVRPGEVLGVVGESGSGKTTLARALIGLQKPSRGLVEHRSDLRDPVDRGRRVAMVFQDPKSSLNPRLSVRSIVADPLVVHRRGDRGERSQAVRALLEDVGLPEALERRKARQLSGGQLQRVALARALALDPVLVLADEPTSALDVSVQAQIVGLLRRLRAERDFAMVLVSHDIRIIRALADRVIVMYDGLIVEEASVRDLFERPMHPYTLTLLASATNAVDAQAEQSARVDELLALPRPFGDRSTLQSSCCPFANRCWRALDECLDRVPRAGSGAHVARCVSPVEAADRRFTLEFAQRTGAPMKAGGE